MVWACTEEGYGVRRGKVLGMELPGRRKKGRLRRRYPDNCERGYGGG